MIRITNLKYNRYIVQLDTLSYNRHCLFEEVAAGRKSVADHVDLVVGNPVAGSIVAEVEDLLDNIALVVVVVDIVELEEELGNNLLSYLYLALAMEEEL